MMKDKYSWGVSSYLENREKVLSSCPQMVEEQRFYHTHLQVITRKGCDLGYLSKGYCAAQDLAVMDTICPSPLSLQSFKRDKIYQFWSDLATFVFFSILYERVVKSLDSFILCSVMINQIRHMAVSLNKLGLLCVYTWYDMFFNNNMGRV